MSFIVRIAVLASLAAPTSAQVVTSAPGCPAPIYFGVCNPFVPGVFVADDKGTMSVVSTWHDSPAEKAGICPGDKIVAVNPEHAGASRWEGLLRELVSDSPGPVILRVQRGKQEFELNVPRVHETVLAALSGEKFLVSIAGSMSVPPDYRLRPVPKGMTPENSEALIDFRARLLRSAGFKQTGGMEMPVATPPEQVRRLQDMADRPQRLAGRIGPSDGAYSAGFTATVFREPTEVFVRSILPGSPAQAIGLLTGDELVEADGLALNATSVENLKGLLARPGEVVLHVRRSDGVHELRVSTLPVTQLMRMLPDAPVPERPKHAADYFTGITAMYDEAHHEAMVSEVSYPSPAFGAGVYPGDFIVSVGSVSSAKLSREQLAGFLAPADSSAVPLVLARSGRRLTVRLMPARYEDALGTVGRKLTKFGPAPLHCPD
jgi:S1-C subfamily serine protease